MKRLGGGSAYSGHLPEGCIQCARGQKMVLFISGICDARCFYCPLSENRKMKDVLYADEMPIREMKDAIEEARMIQASGTGITGGDPMKYYKRTAEYIRMLKSEFGQNHHIHLYTISGSKEGIDEVARAGLDEIRFHPPEEIWKVMDRSVFNDRIRWAKDAGLSVGIEVPSLPGREEDTEALIQYAISKDLDYVNLNELEFSETNASALIGRGYAVKNDYQSGAKGSSALAMKMVRKFEDFTVHYCSASFKDGVQLRNRLKRRAKNVASTFDVITRDGTIVRGIIEGGDLSSVETDLKNMGFSEEMYRLNESMKRVEVPVWLLEKIKNGVGGKYEIYQVEEYPTWDAIEVERLKL
ncbi:MAG: radical SAM protein [Candidatus Thermoplasmatota archaeon]|nr:radical SAM protein [Candidatus Thermoplasmatota archaeon]